MLYNYKFTSPIKFLIKSKNKEVEVDYKQIKFKFPKNLNKILNKNLEKITKNNIEYMNHQGIKKMIFNIKNNSILNITITMDHILSRKEFDSIYKDIQIQLMERLGNLMKKQLLYKYKDSVEYVNDKGFKEYKPEVKQLFCLLWFCPNWRLKFIIGDKK